MCEQRAETSNVSHKNPTEGRTMPETTRMDRVIISMAGRVLSVGVLGLAVALALASPTRGQAPRDRVLYLTHSAGFHHDVLPLSREILERLGEETGAFDVTSTEDVSALAPERLHRYKSVVFYTSGELPLSDREKKGLLDFVRSGHGFVGVHSATDTFYLWRDYRELIGGYFNNHPWHQPVRVVVADPANPLVAFLGPSFEIADEIYQISDFDERRSHVLLRLDPASVDLTKNDVHRRFYGWPLAWTRSFGRGRVFYAALGHDEAVWRDPRYQRLLRNALLWSLRKPVAENE
jgi:uncharacterized protein